MQITYEDPPTWRLTCTVAGIPRGTADAKEQLTSSYEVAELLVAGYNGFAEENGKELIDPEGDIGNPVYSVEQRLNEWVLLSTSRALAVCGRIFEARDEALRCLNLDMPIAD